VVGRHVELKRGGANLMGLCPFHAEKSPSFSVSPAKQFYYCFGCGASGDAIRFLTEHTGMSFVDAVTDLAQTVGMQVPQEQLSPEDRESAPAPGRAPPDADRRAARRSRSTTAAAEGVREAVDYLKGRGLSGEIAARFGLGYAPPGWRGLASVFPNYDDPVLEEAGLVRASADDADTPAEERKRYDWFRHRVMFPIRAVGGEIIGFGARVLDDSKPKYLNSPETPVFSKGRELYGLFEARQAIRERGFCLVVEGYMDVVALAQSGFGNAVATWARPARPTTSRSCSASPMRWSSASTATTPAGARPGARWKPRCPTPPTCARCASCSCRPSTTPTASCANWELMPSNRAIEAGHAAVAAVVGAGGSRRRPGDGRRPRPHAGAGPPAVGRAARWRAAAPTAG
jgi:hypothetical protein